MPVADQPAAVTREDALAFADEAFRNRNITFSHRDVVDMTGALGTFLSRRLASVSSASAEGFVLVPRKLDPAMASAGWSRITVGLTNGEQEAMERLWSALLDAAPKSEPVPTTNQAGEVERRFWLIVHKPGNVPERKGSWPITEMTKVLREFIAARPDSYLHVVTIDRDGVPEVEHGPEALQMADGRSMSVGRKHNARTLAAHTAALATQPATSQEGEGFRAVEDPDHQYAVVSADYCRPFLAGAYATLEAALRAQNGKPDRWHIYHRLAATPTHPTLSEDLRALSERATRGEWRVAEGSVEDGSIYIDASENGECPVAMIMSGSPHNQDRADAAFIVAAVEHVRAQVSA